MYYLSAPLKAVPAPKVKNRWRYGLELFGVWVGVNVTIDVFLYVVARLVGAEMPTPAKQHLLEIDMLAIMAVITLVFVYSYHIEAQAKRWRKAAYPVYDERVTEARAWAWTVTAAALIDGTWHIACYRQDASGKKEHNLSIPEEHVTAVGGASDRLAFEEIVFTASSRPGHNDRVMIGGHVTLTFEAERGGPPPFETHVHQDH